MTIKVQIGGEIMTNNPAHQTVNLQRLIVNSYPKSTTEYLRKCSGYWTEYDSVLMQHVKNHFTHALFHQFGSNFIEFESGAGNYTTAIVELEDGQVVEAVVSSIKFER